MSTVAALYIDKRGPYPKLPDVDCWDEARDARGYNGPYPVVAHPPCAAWCQLAGVREARYGYPRGEDGGLFQSAVDAVMRWGGVLEHPAFSKAWLRHGILPPRARQGWRRSSNREWVCQVSQCAYGARMRKHTWILYVGDVPPFELDWAVPYKEGTAVISGMSNRRASYEGYKRVWSSEAKRTPVSFAETLVALARHGVRRSFMEAAQ